MGKKIDEVVVWRIATGVFAILFLVTLINGGLPIGVSDTVQAQQQTAPSKGEIDMTVYDDDAVKGSSTAPITVIVYSDPSCPYCAAAAGSKSMVDYMKTRTPSYEAAVPGIIKNFVDKGKARIVFRYYPGHGTGAEAMKIMFCANDQNKFWEVHDLVFENQDKVSDTAFVKDLAKQAGVNVLTLESCISSGKYNSKLEKDTNLGRAAGVSGTPSFVVNGQLVVGAQPYSAFEQAFNTMLS